MTDYSDISVITLTIEGYRLDFEKIVEGLYLTPGSTERRGERDSKGRVYELDKWSRSFPIPVRMSPTARLKWLRNHLQPASAFLHRVRERADVTLRYTAYTFGNGHRARLDPAALAPFMELDIPLDIQFVKFDPPPYLTDEDIEGAVKAVRTAQPE